jgi:glutaredoxin
MNAISTPVKLYRMVTPESECPWGVKASALLTEQGIEFEDIHLTSRAEVDAFKAQQGVTTTPQIFFGADRIGGYTDLAAKLNHQIKPSKTSYQPVIALFSVAALMSLALSLGMPGFMGISLSMLAALKLMDIRSFATSFRAYDLIAMRVKSYGKVYPFLELAIGLGFLSGVAALATGLSSLLVGMVGTISIIKAIYIDKKALNCACIGGNSNVPLGTVSIAENAMMVIMGLMLVVGSAVMYPI